jgi:hypothetical protein
LPHPLLDQSGQAQANVYYSLASIIRWHVLDGCDGSAVCDQQSVDVNRFFDEISLRSSYHRRAWESLRQFFWNVDACQIGQDRPAALAHMVGVSRYLQPCLIPETIAASAPRRNMIRAVGIVADGWYSP